MSEQEKEITQPIVVDGPSASHSDEEGTQPVKISPDAPESQLPEWLVKFASNPEPELGEIEPGNIPNFDGSFFDEMEEGQAFTPPVMPEENAWQELSDFQDPDPLEFEPIGEPGEIEPVVEDVEVAEAVIALDPQVEAANKFKQEVRDMLKQGQRDEALALIRDNKTDQVLAEAAKKTLRSQLTLSSDAEDLWEIYDELNSSSL